MPSPQTAFKRAAGFRRCRTGDRVVPLPGRFFAFAARWCQIATPQSTAQANNRKAFARLSARVRPSRVKSERLQQNPGTRVANYLNLTAKAWRQLRHSGQLPGPHPWQQYVYGTLYSGANCAQTLLYGAQRKKISTTGAVVVLGFWRSGTTLLHELLCADNRFGYPTTYACLNPHHFILTQAGVLKRITGQIRRVQDRMLIGLGSPQEDEFALLCLGARSPYEGMLAPQKFGEAFSLADPNDLSPGEARYWRLRFHQFYRGVSLVSGGKPLILKSPAHSYRVASLRGLLPDARFIVIVRNPYEVFESMLRTYRALTGRYGLGPTLPDDEVRSIILTERKRFEAKLHAGLRGLPAKRVVFIQFEALVRNPVAAIESLYRAVELPPFGQARQNVVAEVTKRSGYRPDGIRPDSFWRQRIATEWSDIFARYGYSHSPRAGG